MDDIKVICPHCGYEYDDYLDLVDPVDMDASFDMPCDGCGEEFHITMTTQVTLEVGPAEGEAEYEG